MPELDIRKTVYNIDIVCQVIPVPHLSVPFVKCSGSCLSSALSAIFCDLLPASLFSPRSINLLKTVKLVVKQPLTEHISPLIQSRI